MGKFHATVRCFIPPSQWKEKGVLLSGLAAHHLIHVLRVTPGAPITCFDGQGNEADAVVVEKSRRYLKLTLSTRRTAPLEDYSLTLGVALPRHGKLDEIVSQATQLGVHRIVPLKAERGVVQVPLERWARKEDRLRQIAIEAGKQSGRSRLPVLEPILPLAEFIPSFSHYDLILLFTVEGPAEELAELVVKSPSRHLLLLIGPEGDFSPKEIRQAEQAGAHLVSLGPTVLRCETACAVAVGIVSFLLREKGKGVRPQGV